MIEFLHPFGDCLQIGMGRKMVAASIQTFHPKSHTIIENDPFLLEKNKEWMDKHPHIQVIQNLWPEALHSLGIFDVIYCEIQEIGALWPQFAMMRYSDKDLEFFCKETSKTFPDQLFRFLHELAHNGQITIEQLDKALNEYRLTGTVPKLKRSSRQMVACLKVCLDSHMRTGSFFGTPLDDLSIAYEDPLFTQIAVDPYVGVRDYEGAVVVEKFGP